MIIISSSVSLEYINSINFGSNIDSYHYNLSTNNTTVDIPVGDLLYRLTSTGSTTLSLYIAPASGIISVPVDIKRTTQYDGASIETQIINNGNISISTALDTIIYSDSRETHLVRLRQQLTNGTWSLHDIYLFASASNARVDIIVVELADEIEYVTP